MADLNANYFLTKAKPQQSKYGPRQTLVSRTGGRLAHKTSQTPTGMNGPISQIDVVEGGILNPLIPEEYVLSCTDSSTWCNITHTSSKAAT